MGGVLQRVVFNPPQPTGGTNREIIAVKNPGDGHQIPVISIPCKKPRFVVIYSHGNAEDLSSVASWCETISTRLRVSVFAYDYRGYGRSLGAASEENVFSDVVAVVNYVKKFFPEDKMVFFGRSLGCAPSIKAATVFKNSRGLIIESPFLTCVKTVLNTQHTFFFDLFRNEDSIRDCRQPTLVIHGKHDGIVPFRHGEMLYEIAPNPWGCLWLERAGHNDIDTHFRSDLFRKIDHFLGDISTDAQENLRRR